MFILIVNVIIIPDENKSKGGGKGGKPKGCQLKGGKVDKSDKQPDQQPDVCRFQEDPSEPQNVLLPF